MSKQDRAVGVAMALNDVADEMTAARTGNGPFTSAHHAMGVLFEEVDELWDEVKKKRAVRSKAQMRHEAIQVAAAALNMIVDLELGR